MSRQTTLSDVAQRTLSESVDAPTEREDDTPTTKRDLLDRAQVQATNVAASRMGISEPKARERVNGDLSVTSVRV